MALRGKWADGIVPRNFAWVIKDSLAVCERPGGNGENHRRVRRMEEIIWIRQQEFDHVISLIPATHNLHNYDELEMPYLHRPFGAHEPVRPFLASFYPELRTMLADGRKLVVHGEEVGDRLCGLVGGYLLWSEMVPLGPQAISVTERLLTRKMGPIGRGIVTEAGALAGAVGT